MELRSPAPHAIAELAGGTWRCLDVAAAPSPRGVALAPGLAVVAGAALPDYCANLVFREALGQVIASATRHLDVIQRVATVSRRAHTDNRALRADLDRLGRRELVARSPAMRDAVRRAELVARHATTVLIIGESGSGKEVLAREIHRLSDRAHRPMIHVNCGAIPDALVESELFGHERGAFTGADRTHAGVFERAHGGTLLLDEIGELPLPAQVKLLRVLQERQIRRVGGEAQLAVDVRLVAATNRSLAHMVEQGTFREDLYYRLDVFAIRVPPLRERRGDLAPLVASLSGDLARKLDLPAPQISRGVLARLAAYSWPGNVRELMNVLESALILGGGATLELPDEFPQRAARAQRGSGFEGAVRRAIEDALRTTSGKIYGAGGAAALLGLKPGTLQSKMRKLGIARASFAAAR